MTETLPYRKINIRPIRNEADYDAALEELESVFNAKQGTAEADKAEVLTVLIKSYEDKHFEFNLPDPIDAIKLAMEEREMNQKDLAKYVGGTGMASLLLNRKRKLSINNVRLLSELLQIPTSVLVQDYSIVE